MTTHVGKQQADGGQVRVTEPTQPDVLLLGDEQHAVMLNIDRKLYKLSEAQARLLRDNLTKRLARLRKRKRIAAKKAQRHEQVKRNDSPFERWRRDVHG